MENNNKNNTEINIISSKMKATHKLPPLRGNKEEVKSSDALRRAKAKYYQKKKQDEAYMQDMRNRSHIYYHEHKKIEEKEKEIEKYFPKITAY